MSTTTPAPRKSKERSTCPIGLGEEGVTSMSLLKLTPVAMHGYMHKRGKRLKRWTRRYFALKASVLLVYKKEADFNADVEPTALIDLHGYSAFFYNECVDDEQGILLQREEQQLILSCDPEISSGWVSTFNMNIASIGIDDFETISEIGRGSYGLVFLVRRKSDNALLAMKKIPKDVSVLLPRRSNEDEETYSARITRQNRKNVKYVIGERSVLHQADSPYIVSLRGSFETSEAWYILMDYVAGGDAFDHASVQHQNRFSESVVKIWAAQLVSALQHVHQKGFLHRDIKLENLLLDSRGRMCLADWGFSRCLRQRDGSMSKTSYFCGTKYYIAPEMLGGDKTYNHSVDWWGLGVAVYELLTGCPPFFSRNRDRLYQKVLHAKVVFYDPDWHSPEAQHFVRELLVKDPAYRLGCRGSEEEAFAELRAHPFFDDIDWKAIDQGHVEPDFKPKGAISSLRSTLVDFLCNKRSELSSNSADSVEAKVARDDAPLDILGFHYNPTKSGALIMDALLPAGLCNGVSFYIPESPTVTHLSTRSTASSTKGSGDRDRVLRSTGMPTPNSLSSMSPTVSNSRLLDSSTIPRGCT